MKTMLKPGLALAGTLLAAACGAASTAGGASPAGRQGTVITTRSGAAGTYLTDGTGHSVYLWVKDPSGKSVCSGACAGAWPPVPASGPVTASGGAKAADLGSVTRSDGTKQVTYAGHPLYYFAGDSGAGQTSGQGSDGFGARWWLVAPAGTQLTGGAPSAPSSSSSSSSGGGYGGGY